MMRFSVLYRIFCWLTVLTITYSSSNDLDIASLSLDKGFCISAESPDDDFGGAVSEAGDINGDGVADILISAGTGITTGTTNAGYVYVIFGNKNGFSNMDLATGLGPTEGFKINGIFPGQYFGWSISGGGDINNDGIADLAIGAVFNPNTPILTPDGGAGYVVFGKKNWTPISINIADVLLPDDGFNVIGGITFGYLGHSISITSDINGDCIADLIIGGPKQNGSSGNVYVVYGQRDGTQLTLSKGFKISGLSNSYFGARLSRAGDFNGDGIDDILIGAPNDGGTDVGRVHIIFGRKGEFTANIDISSGFSIVQGIVISGTVIGDNFGDVNSDAGDFNGDGIADILVGACMSNPQGRIQAGTVYIFFGSKTGLTNIDLAQGLSRAQGFKIEGSNIDKKFGFTLSKAGDINGDGIDDIIVGADSTITADSTAYVFYGRRTGIKDIDLENGLEETRGFRIKYSGAYKIGNAVGYAGDVNGDGKSDIILGARPEPELAPSDAPGKVYVIYGVGIPGIELIQVIASTQGAAKQVARGFALLLSLINFSNAGAVLFTALAEILHYMKYMNIRSPPRLQYILDQPDPEFLIIPYLSAAPEEIEDIATKYELPENFERYDIHPGFMVNCWSPIITIAIIIGGMLVTYLGMVATSSCKSIYSRFAKIKEALKWNYLLAIFTGYFGVIAFNTAFQIWMARYNTAVDRASFYLCILFNIAVIGVSVRIISITYKMVKEYKQTQQAGSTRQPLEKLKEEYKDYRVIFEGFKSNSLFQNLICSCSISDSTSSILLSLIYLSNLWLRLLSSMFKVTYSFYIFCF